VGDQEIGRPGRPVSPGLQMPGKQRHCLARTRPHGGLSNVQMFMNDRPNPLT
jgi:hypothetical protein